MKESIDNIRYLKPYEKGYDGPPAITCTVNGRVQTPHFLTLIESFNLDVASEEQREANIRRLANKYFNAEARMPKNVAITDVRVVNHQWKSGSGNYGLFCEIEGVRVEPKGISPLMYAGWKNTPDDEKSDYERRMVEFVYRDEIAEIIRNRKPMVIHMKGDLYLEQMVALLQKAGFYPKDDVMSKLQNKGIKGAYIEKGLDNSETRHFKNIVLLAQDNRIMDIVNDPETIYEYHNTTLAKLLADKLVSDVDITDKLADGNVYVSCRINGVAQSPKVVGEALLNKYKQGVYAEKDIAVCKFYQEMLDTEKVQRIEVDMGCRIMDGKNITYQGEQGEYGVYYKDSDAFSQKKGICYISESAYEDYETSLKEGKEINIEEFGWDYKDILDEARERSFRNPEDMAQYVFDHVEGYAISTEMEEIAANCSEEELMNTQEELQTKWKWFVESHRKQPNYARVFVRWKEDGCTEEHDIALNQAAGEYADEEVLFTCQSPEDFFRLEKVDNGENFRIVEFVNYSLGTLEEDRKRQQEEHNIVSIERENNWNEDIYIVFIRSNGTGDGCYVKPDGTIYDSTYGLNGQKLNQVVGSEIAKKVMEMKEFDKLDLKTFEISNRSIITDMVLKRKGVFPYEKGMLRCKINGEQQPWQDITLHEYRNVVHAVTKEERESIKTALVNKYFADVLRSNLHQEQQQSKGFKR